MKIGIDCRYIGLSGMGRVIEGFLDYLDFNENEYVLIGTIDKLNRYKYKATIISFDYSPYSPKGFLNFPTKEVNKLDQLFIPNFLIPLGVKIPVYIIVHDLIFLEYKDSCKNYIDYQLKKYLLKSSIQRSTYIFTVSNTTKNSLNNHFQKTKNKSETLYIGLSNNVLNFKEQVQKENIMIYVGNVKSHKGIDTLISAFEKFKLKDNEAFKLMIVGNKDHFRTSYHYNYDLNKSIEFTGFIEDEEMLTLLSKSKYLIQPSRIEGFGIPPLEALYLGTKPIISNIDVFKEIYRDFNVDYFRVDDSDDLCSTLENSIWEVANQKDKIVGTYSYEKMSKEIVRKMKGIK